MSGNTFGKLFTVTTFGESHGPALGCVVDGCPPGLQLSTDDIQQDLDRRRPGQSKHTTQRRESDRALAACAKETRTVGLAGGGCVRPGLGRAVAWPRAGWKLRLGDFDVSKDATTRRTHR